MLFLPGLLFPGLEACHFKDESLIPLHLSNYLTQYIQIITMITKTLDSLLIGIILAAFPWMVPKGDHGLFLLSEIHLQWINRKVISLQCWREKLRVHGWPTTSCQSVPCHWSQSLHLQVTFVAGWAAWVPKSRGEQLGSLGLLSTHLSSKSLNQTEMKNK